MSNVRKDQTSTTVTSEGSQLLVSPRTATIAIDATQQLIISGATAAPKWASIDPAVASVSKTGLVRGVKGGVAVVQVKAGRATDNATITVQAGQPDPVPVPPVARLALTSLGTTKDDDWVYSTVGTYDPDGTLNGGSLVDSQGTIATWATGPPAASYTRAGYAAAGTKTVTLTVRDNQGNPGVASIQVKVEASPITPPAQQAPSATLTFVSGQFVGDPITLALAASDPDGTIASYSLAWGDGQTTSAATPPPGTLTHTYAAASNFTAVLTVTDNDGLVGTASRVVSVVTRPAVNRPPIAAFARISGNLVGSVITFSTVGSGDPDGNLDNWSIVYGDGSGDHGTGLPPSAPTHTYQATGTYSAILTVTDSLGLSNSRTISVAITASAGTTGLTAGWATFGLALQQGAATTGVQVGSLTTQTDVKNRWADGSIKFAVVTTLVVTPGTYTIAPGPVSGSALTPTWPTATVVFSAPTTTRFNRALGATYTATLPAFSGADPWLAGDQVREARVIVTPMNGATPHPTLRVRFDVRSYSNGQHRVDVAVDNILDIAILQAWEYNLAITVNAVVTSYTNLLHCAFTRARFVRQTASLSLSAVTPDPETYYNAQALPRYRDDVVSGVYPSVGSPFEPFQFGGMDPFMNSSGTRPELSTYPDWAIQAFTHRTAEQLAYVKKNGDLAASWSVYATRDTTAYLPVDMMTVPYWFDPRGGTTNGPKNGFTDVTNSFAAWPTGNVNTPFGAALADTAHFGSFELIPYLWTGDRWYSDQLRASAWYRMAAVNPTDRDGLSVPGDLGRVHSQENRGVGHSVREIHDAAQWLPDADPWQDKFVYWLESNLFILDFVATTPLPGFGLNNPIPWMWPYKSNVESFWIDSNGHYIAGFSHWEHMQQLIAVEWAIRAGSYTGGQPYLSRMMQTALGMFMHEPSFQRLNAGPYRLGVAWYTTFGESSVNYHLYPTWAEVEAATHITNGGPGTTPLTGPWYGMQLRGMLILCKRRELAGDPLYAGASAALTWLMMQNDGPNSTMVGTTAVRSGYAFTEVA